MKWLKATGKRLSGEYTINKREREKVFFKNFRGDFTEI